MARAITAPELTKLRSNQYSRLYLAIHSPAPVFKARINQAFTVYDEITEVAFDTVTLGAYGDVKADMTVYVGTTEGAYDLGMMRMRANADASKLYCYTSEIEFQDDAYLTAVSEWTIWQKHPLLLEDGTIYMDYSIAYTDQHASPDPFVVMGGDAVKWLTSATVTYTPDASGSYTVDGTSIANYLWTATGASATSGLTTATPTITYNAAGCYLVTCTVYASNGKSFTGYRHVFVFTEANPPATQFTLEGCSGNADAGGWQFQVILYDQALQSEVRDRAKVILFARDWYAGAEGSIGPVSGEENIIAEGWIVGESITRDPNINTVGFDVQGLQYFMGQMTGFPSGLEDSAFADNGGGYPDRWTEFENLTADKMLWHFLHWRTTATRCVEIPTLTGSALIAAQIAAPAGTLWQQLTTIAETTVLARPICDRYNRLFVEIDAQYTYSRASIPIVQALDKTDYIPPIEIERNPMGTAGMVELSGVYYTGGLAAPMGARSPGALFAHYGDYTQIGNLALGDQAQTIILAGLYSGRLNNEYPNVSIDLAANNRFIDIAPRQFVSLTLSATDTERGVIWTAKNLIPRSVDFSYTHSTGVLLTSIETEGETFQGLAVPMSFPGEEGSVVTPPGGEKPPGGEGGGGGEEPPPPTQGEANVVASCTFGVWAVEDFEVDDPVWVQRLVLPDETTNIDNIIDGHHDAVNREIYYVVTRARTSTETWGDQVWKASDIATAAGVSTWEKIFDIADYASRFPGLLLTRVRCTPVTGDRLYILACDKTTYETVVFRSFNAGLTWNYTVVCQEEAVQVKKPYTLQTGTSTWQRSAGGPSVATSFDFGYDANLGGEPWILAFKLAYTGSWTGFGWGWYVSDNGIVRSGTSGVKPLTKPWAINNLAKSAEKPTIDGWLDDAFGVGGYRLYLYPGLNFEYSETYTEQSIRSNSAEGSATVYHYAFFNKENIKISEAIDIAKLNEQWMYVSSMAMINIYGSYDGGVTWEKIPTHRADMGEEPGNNHGAKDICVDPLLAGVFYYWDSSFVSGLNVNSGKVSTNIWKPGFWGPSGLFGAFPLSIARQWNGGGLWVIVGNMVEQISGYNYPIWINPVVSVATTRGLICYLASPPRMLWTDQYGIWDTAGEDPTPYRTTITGKNRKGNITDLGNGIRGRCVHFLPAKAAA